jgi:hypothetical protein
MLTWLASLLWLVQHYIFLRNFFTFPFRPAAFFPYNLPVHVALFISDGKLQARREDLVIIGSRSRCRLMCRLVCLSVMSNRSGHSESVDYLSK